MKTGSKIDQLNNDAYMNGYTRETFSNYELSKHNLDLLKGLEPAPEAGSFFAHYGTNK